LIFDTLEIRITSLKEFEKVLIHIKDLINNLHVLFISNLYHFEFIGNYFNSDVPNYLNYGGIGYVIGHEITHGFDTQGKQYDSLGNLVNWWKPKTEEKFKKRTQCMIWQYGNYTVKQVNMKLDGILTQGENIGDNGGVNNAYLAYGNYHISF
jgi:membrane metallo-endopeptidase-like protein 1